MSYADGKAFIMAVKTNQNLKKQKKMEKKAKVDKLTNWIMINLAWGVAGFLALRYISNPLMTDYDETFRSALGIVAIIFGVVALLLLGWGLLTKYGVIKSKPESKPTFAKAVKASKRFVHYGFFTAVVAIVVYYLSIYHKVRIFVLDLIPALRGTFFENQEWWTTNGLTYALVAYMVVIFVYGAIKMALIERKK